MCLTISSDEEDAAAAPSSPTLEPVLTPSEADPGAAGDGSLSGDELATRGVLGTAAGSGRWISALCLWVLACLWVL